MLRKVYGLAPSDAAAALRALLALKNVEVDRPAVEAGRVQLDAGGVIAYEGRWRRGETFVSFDGQAVGLLAAQGHSARLLG